MSVSKKYRLYVQRAKSEGKNPLDFKAWSVLTDRLANQARPARASNRAPKRTVRARITRQAAPAPVVQAEKPKFERIAHRCDFMGVSKRTGLATLAVDTSERDQAMACMGRLGVSVGNTYTSKRGERVTLLLASANVGKAQRKLATAGFVTKGF